MNADSRQGYSRNNEGGGGGTQQQLGEKRSGEPATGGSHSKSSNHSHLIRTLNLQQQQQEAHDNDEGRSSSDADETAVEIPGYMNNQETEISEVLQPRTLNFHNTAARGGEQPLSRDASSGGIRTLHESSNHHHSNHLNQHQSLEEQKAARSLQPNVPRPSPGGGGILSQLQHQHSKRRQQLTTASNNFNNEIDDRTGGPGGTALRQLQQQNSSLSSGGNNNYLGGNPFHQSTSINNRTRNDIVNQQRSQYSQNSNQQLQSNTLSKQQTLNGVASGFQIRPIDPMVIPEFDDQLDPFEENKEPQTQNQSSKQKINNQDGLIMSNNNTASSSLFPPIAGATKQTQESRKGAQKSTHNSSRRQNSANQLLTTNVEGKRNGGGANEETSPKILNELLSASINNKNINGGDVPGYSQNQIYNGGAAVGSLNNTQELEFPRSQQASLTSQSFNDPEVQNIEVYSYAQLEEEIESQGYNKKSSRSKRSKKATTTVVTDLEATKKAETLKRKSTKVPGTARSYQTYRAPPIPHISQLFVEGSLAAQYNHKKTMQKLKSKKDALINENSKYEHQRSIKSPPPPYMKLLSHKRKDSQQHESKQINNLLLSQGGENEVIADFNSFKSNTNQQPPGSITAESPSNVGVMNPVITIQIPQELPQYATSMSRKTFIDLDSPDKRTNTFEGGDTGKNGSVGGAIAVGPVATQPGLTQNTDHTQIIEDDNFGQMTERKLFASVTKGNGEGDEGISDSAGPSFGTGTFTNALAGAINPTAGGSPDNNLVVLINGNTSNNVSFNGVNGGGGSTSGGGATKTGLNTGKTAKVFPLMNTPDGSSNQRDNDFTLGGNDYNSHDTFQGLAKKQSSRGKRSDSIQEDQERHSDNQEDREEQKDGNQGEMSDFDFDQQSGAKPNREDNNVSSDSSSDNNEEDAQNLPNSGLKRQKTIVQKGERKKRKEQVFLESQRLRNLKTYNYFVILPDDPFKKKWDILITFMLLFTALVSPYRIAFVEVDSTAWTAVESLTDCIFGLDLILNFFYAYYDQQDEVVDQRKLIALNYLKGWFMIDFFTILPISQLMNTSDYGNLARIARLPKLYRLIKILRLMRILKVVKERQMLIKYVNEVFRLNAGFERLIFFIMMSIVLCHICCCFWVILANLSTDSNDWVDTWIYRLGYVDLPDADVYIASMYFVLTTFTTVGFGDINGVTIPERIFCLFLMLIGAVAFSFAVSSLSQMLSAIDTRSAQLRERLATLNQIKRQYRLSFDLQRRLRSALKYDYSRNSIQQFLILNELPQNLKIELALLMNKEIIKKVFFFKNKPPYFIAFVGPLLKPMRIEQGNFIYREGDPIEEIFFLTKGKAAFVSKQCDQLPYLMIEAGYFFGEIDFVYQSYLNVQQAKKSGNAEEQEGAGSSPGQSNLKRIFSVKAFQSCDLLALSKGDLLRVEAEFEDIVAEMFMHAHKKIKKTLAIKDEAENRYLKNKAQLTLNNGGGSPNVFKTQATIKVDKNGQMQWVMSEDSTMVFPIRRMASCLYGESSKTLPNAINGGPGPGAIENEEDEEDTPQYRGSNVDKKRVSQSQQAKRKSSKKVAHEDGPKNSNAGGVGNGGGDMLIPIDEESEFMEGSSSESVHTDSNFQDEESQEAEDKTPVNEGNSNSDSSHSAANFNPKQDEDHNRRITPNGMQDQILSLTELLSLGGVGIQLEQIDDTDEESEESEQSQESNSLQRDSVSVNLQSSADKTQSQENGKTKEEQRTPENANDKPSLKQSESKDSLNTSMLDDEEGGSISNDQSFRNVKSGNLIISQEGDQLRKQKTNNSKSQSPGRSKQGLGVDEDQPQTMMQTVDPNAGSFGAAAQQIQQFPPLLGSISAKAKFLQSSSVEHISAPLPLDSKSPPRGAVLPSRNLAAGASTTPPQNAGIDRNSKQDLNPSEGPALMMRRTLTTKSRKGGNSKYRKEKSRDSSVRGANSNHGNTSNNGAPGGNEGKIKGPSTQHQRNPTGGSSSNVDYHLTPDAITSHRGSKASSHTPQTMIGNIGAGGGNNSGLVSMSQMLRIEAKQKELLDGMNERITWLEHSLAEVQVNLKSALAANGDFTNNDAAAAGKDSHRIPHFQLSPQERSQMQQHQNQNLNNNQAAPGSQNIGGASSISQNGGQPNSATQGPPQGHVNMAQPQNAPSQSGPISEETRRMIIESLQELLQNEFRT